MSLKDWYTRLALHRTVENSYFSIPAERIVDTYTPNQSAAFAPRETYFEIRLKQMFLRNQREYFREFVPMACVTAEFQFAGKRVRAPSIVGPNRLADSDKVAKGDQIEFRNIRLVGPCPYEGEDLEMFVGLFRVVTRDWSKQALSLLETLVKTLDSTRLSSLVRLAEPLSAGVEGFLGMEEVESRLAYYLQYESPGSDSGDGKGVLRPSFEVFLRYPQERLTPRTEKEFWVKEGRLFYGDSASGIREFTDADFALISLNPLTVRNDILSYEFHTKYWPRVEQLLAQHEIDQAFEAFKLLAASLVECDDVTYPHRVSLLKAYRKRMDHEIGVYKDIFDRRPETTGTMRGGQVARRANFGEVDLLSALETTPPEAELPPELLMARFTNRSASP